VDSIEPRNGAIVFSWLMPTPPKTQAQANAIRAKALRVPFLNGTMVSEDGLAIALYLPITEKKLSYRVYRELQKKIATFGQGPEEFHITGLPVAEDTFGVEMFVQMAISAPAAMLVKNTKPHATAKKPCSPLWTNSSLRCSTPRSHPRLVLHRWR